jgi:hypothetical protein
MSVRYLYGDILSVSSVDVVVHQCNCLTTKSHGLSQQIGDKYQWADIYRTRRKENGRNLAVSQDRGVPGTLRLMKSPIRDSPHVVCFLSQWDFGRGLVRKIPPFTDTRQNRLKWFSECLKQLGKLPYQTCASPYKIACGLAGGHWPTYLHLIKDFSRAYNKDVLIIVPNWKRIK